ncbi:MAG: hypothetical protein AAF585_13620, partial [Verrucomicrobiota bacterium]
LQIKLRSSSETTVEFRVNDKSLGDPKTVKSGNEYVDVVIPLTNNAAWTGEINSLEIKLGGEPGTHVEVDTIQVVR